MHAFSTQTPHLVLNIVRKVDRRFSSLGNAKRIMAISAIHGELEKLISLHDTIFPYISPGDRIVYTGNYIGYGPKSSDVVDELLSFRRAVLAKRGMIASDIIYLRGEQEEMWQKLMQLQFAPSPIETMVWMLGNGLSNTLYSYGMSPHDGVVACRQGIVGLSQWTNKLKDAFKAKPGHDTFATHLVRAAYSPQTSEYPMLFVHSGIDNSKPLNDQGDSFWWATDKFEKMDQAYEPFQKIIRGYDPKHQGVNYNCIKATIDGGCGFGGDLICAVFDDSGELLDSLAC